MLIASGGRCYSFFGKFESRKCLFRDFNSPSTKFSSHSADCNSSRSFPSRPRAKKGTRAAAYFGADGNHFLVRARSARKNPTWFAIWLCRSRIHYNFKVVCGYVEMGKRRAAQRDTRSRFFINISARPAHVLMNIYTREIVRVTNSFILYYLVTQRGFYTINFRL